MPWRTEEKRDVRNGSITTVNLDPWVWLGQGQRHPHLVHLRDPSISFFWMQRLWLLVLTIAWIMLPKVSVRDIKIHALRGRRKPGCGVHSQFI